MRRIGRPVLWLLRLTSRLVLGRWLACFGYLDLLRPLNSLRGWCRRLSLRNGTRPGGWGVELGMGLRRGDDLRPGRKRLRGLTSRAGPRWLRTTLCWLIVMRV
jgi:hypothetical protein